ncbi:hypothetical protein HCU40_12285 [Pseudanabaena biceps]|nr:hypothetical protein [Pseudanabaena biceps]
MSLKAFTESRKFQKDMVAGGVGFIGSHYVRYALTHLLGMAALRAAIPKMICRAMDGTLFLVFNQLVMNRFS